MMNLLERCKAAGCAKSLTREENYQLYQRLIQGDESARERMIEGNMGLVIVRMNAYLRKCPKMSFFRDDLISAGLCGLIEAVTRMQDGNEAEKVNPTGYIYTAIDQAMTRDADEESTIKIPQRTQQKAREAKRPIEKPVFVGTKTQKTVFSHLKERDFHRPYEIREEMLAACDGELERSIIVMHLEGYTDVEIARVLGLHRLNILKARNRICTAFKERWEALDK
jgi:RNA polymerase sigma factor (sigma-70 family)